MTTEKISFIRLTPAAKRAAIHPVHMKRLATNPAYAHLGCPKLVVLGPRSLCFVEQEFDAWLLSRVEARDRTKASTTT